MTNKTQTIHIAYGSESGNAHALAYQLKQALQAFTPKLCELNSVNLQNLSTADLLLIVTSTTGDGEAPFNAEQFLQSLIQTRIQQRMKPTETTKIKCQYAVFGIGDVNYRNFCGFSKVIDGLLDKTGAIQLASRVDADVDYEAFFATWSQAVLAHLNGEQGADMVLKQLCLQVNPDE